MPTVVPDQDAEVKSIVVSSGPWATSLLTKCTNVDEVSVSVDPCRTRGD